MAKPKQDLKRVTFWMSMKKIDALMKLQKQPVTASELMRNIVDEHLERTQSAQAHRRMYNKLTDKDFDLRLF